MIYTVTLNPAIDYIVRLDHVETGAVNRMASEDKFAGGKGINVSRVLKRLDIENTATGFIGGFTGRFIEDQRSHFNQLCDSRPRYTDKCQDQS